MKQKIKRFFNKLSNKYFYGNYNNQILSYENKKTSLIDYIIKILFIWFVTTLCLLLIFPNIYLSIVIGIVVTIFLINTIILNAKKIEHQYFVLSQLTIYVSQVSMFINYNNVYSSLKETLRFLSYPLKDDLEKVIKNIESGMTISDSFKSFNAKYNNNFI